MKKLSKTNIVLIGVAVISVFGNLIEEEKEPNSEKANFIETRIEQNIEDESDEKVCDGINIIDNCFIDGIEYILYKYHPEIEETYHYEYETKYKKEIIGYCTLCRDGTYSPSCATGKGACSHHGGVAQWDAPIYKEVPYKEKIKIIDEPYRESFYETVLKD